LRIDCSGRRAACKSTNRSRYGYLYSSRAPKRSSFTQQKIYYFCLDRNRRDWPISGRRMDLDLAATLNLEASSLFQTWQWQQITR